MRVAALGRTKMLYDSILRVHEAGHQVVLIGTCPAAPEYGVTERDFQKLARKLGCPFFCDSRINQPKYLQRIRSCGAEAAIGMNWLTLIGEEVLGLFRHGVINAHAGDLPRFRGNACPNWAILSGEKRVVLTLHQMTMQLDAGPIVLQRAMPLDERTYIFDVYRFLEEQVPGMFVEALDGLAAGRITPRHQPSDPALSLRCFPRHPRDGEIDWKLPAEQIARLVRASAEPFSGAYTVAKDRRLVVWRARAGRLPYPYLGCPGQVAERRESGEVAVIAGEGVLILEEVQLEKGARKRAADQITSTRTRLGLDVVATLARRKR